MLVRILAAVLILGMAGWLAVLGAVCLCAGRTWTPAPSDCIVVLGAHVWMDGRMSNALTYRCEAALSAWRDGIAPAIITCGGRGGNEPEAEAIVMRRWFIAHGVPGSQVFAEPDSTSTLENLRNAHAIMAGRGFESCAVCTNNYHLQRALWQARDEGLTATGIAAPSTKDPLSFARGRCRETCSWILYFLRKL
ncbi:MAG: YdcF family protein [Clostridia bacterium]|nr:YdcF family protein [Clostridia bacterium]